MKLVNIQLNKKECICILEALASQTFRLSKEKTKFGNIKPKHKKEYEISKKLENFFSEAVSKLD